MIMVDPEIIYSDENIIAVAKPAGMVVHHDSKHDSGTLVDILLKKFPDIRGVGENPLRPGIVHRLDRETSGVMILAQNQKTFLYLKDLFQKSKVKKRYVALVVGKVAKESGVINAPIARSTKHFERRVVGGRQGKTREAITEYRVREKISDYTLLDVFPKTGRTHQIRSHLAHIGHPVVCDKLYGGKRFVCPEGLSRQFLHAYSLELALPNTSHIKIEAELPTDLVECLKRLRGK